MRTSETFGPVTSVELISPLPVSGPSIPLRPMPAVKGGDLWLMRTPWGRAGFFYEAWEHGGPRWKRVAVPATECGRISAEFLEEERSGRGFEEDGRTSATPAICALSRACGSSRAIFERRPRERNI